MILPAGKERLAEFCLFTRDTHKPGLEGSWEDPRLGQAQQRPRLPRLPGEDAGSPAQPEPQEPEWHEGEKKEEAPCGREGTGAYTLKQQPQKETERSARRQDTASTANCIFIFSNEQLETEITNQHDSQRFQNHGALRHQSEKHT